MRLASPRLAVGITMLTLAVAGCGGNQVTVQEVPGGPVDLSVPGKGDALAPAATATATPTPTETPAVDAGQATPTPDGTGASDGAAQTAPDANSGGGTEAPNTGDSATSDQPPPAGSDAEQFENFCAENPGAC